jgi:hypothetical protein
MCALIPIPSHNLVAAADTSALLAVCLGPQANIRGCENSLALLTPRPPSPCPRRYPLNSSTDTETMRHNPLALLPELRLRL